ncbi:MAG: DNA polymerase I [Gemmatimonadales bacterium]|nr:DNA polymerase I [Gemmatimonadales bacterium]NIN10433.1 DNA polymerase I [Gemmatimonadales bacterium]NIN49225.1 DNA polymerase I [Gemmatimonadales bacterium]NIP06689.1 DNA polymerase I [Gemmatimonadales bacterium]NIR00020.1 DNA polymerase I [Gemmatimonadales bacterium]
MPAPCEPRLFLIDGYALIYRAFYAMINRPLRTSRGENTSAVWGIANFLHRLFAEHRPDYVAWVHDAGTSLRTDVYPDYKATREKLDDELQEDFDRSVERIEEMLDAFGVALVAVDGYEADDVIGTLATSAAEMGIAVVIVSGDKDFYQLIAPRVVLLNPGRRGPAAVEEHWVDLSNARERLGVPPERVVDYLALVGDASDNVPGVRGVGDKTARKLIDTYGDLDCILERAGEVGAKRTREALLAEADNARLSRELVTIRRDVPVELKLDELRAGPRDDEVLRQLYSVLEFDSLLPRLESREPVIHSGERYRLVSAVEEVAAAVREARGAAIVAVAVQAASANALRAELIGLTLAASDGRAWYFPFAHQLPAGELVDRSPPANLPALGDPAMQPLAELLQDPRVPKAGHNIKYDWLVLRRAGISLAGVAYDSMLASFVLDPGRRSHALAALVLEHLGVRLPAYGDLVGRGKSERPFAAVPPAEAAEYCCGRCDALLRLRTQLEPQLEQHNVTALLEQIELPLVGVLVDMEWRGIAVDSERLAQLSERFAAELGELEQAIYREAGTEFNINSTPQLRHVLFEKLNLPVLKKTKTGPSTDADVLAEHAAAGFALPRLLLDYRELSKLRSTYVDVLPQWVNPDTGRIHTSFGQTGASTGRLSSSDPNLQNIPVRTSRGEEIRRCFVAGPGQVFIVADYSQIELRLLAHFSEDPAFLTAFRRGGDIHRETAAIIFDVAVEDVTAQMRARAKTINFATIYGQGPFALSRQLGIPVDEAKSFIRLYFERLAGVRRYLDGCVARARELGYAETLFGRRRYIPELRDRTHNVRAFGERVAMNSPLQGSAADLIKRAMIRLATALPEAGLESAIILLQVHDELVVEAPRDEDEVDEARAVVQREMESAAELRIPLVVEIGVGANWLDAKA